MAFFMKFNAGHSSQPISDHISVFGVSGGHVEYQIWVI